MKSLIFAAVAATTVGTFAATTAAQVYDVTFNVKTTKAAYAKSVNNKTNPVAIPGDADELYYRTQTSLTWKGLIWGCNCEAIDGVWEGVTPCVIDADGTEVYGDADTVKGCIVWDTKSKAPVYMGEGVNVDDIDVTSNPGWGWTFLQLIEKNAQGAEALWTIAGAANVCDSDEVTFEFTGAGFGSVAFSLQKNDDGFYSPLCNSYVKKLSGNFAGWMLAPTTDMVDVKEAGCSFCGKVSEETHCDYIDPWEWCAFGSACGCDMDIAIEEGETAAYGTWTIAYNSSLSKKLTNATSIRDAYNFKSLPDVADAIATAEDQVLNVVTACDTLGETLKNAKAAYAAATAEVARVQYQALDEAFHIADKADGDAGQVENAALSAYNTTNGLYTAEYDAYTNTVATYATNVWTVEYSSFEDATGTGLDTLKVELAKNYKITKIVFGDVTYTTKADFNAAVTEPLEAQAEKVAALKADLVKADAAYVAAHAAKELTKAAQVAAHDELDNYVALQIEAYRALTQAETALAAAQAAYDAECN